MRKKTAVVGSPVGRRDLEDTRVVEGMGLRVEIRISPQRRQLRGADRVPPRGLDEIHTAANLLATAAVGADLAIALGQASYRRPVTERPVCR